jgi:hypothetical protein
MSTKPITPRVVENLRAAVYASHQELSAQVQADSALDSKLLGLLAFFVAAASILFATRGPILFAIAYSLLSLT